MQELINKVGKFHGDDFNYSIGNNLDLVLKMFQDPPATQASMDFIYIDIKPFTPLENGAV